MPQLLSSREVDVSAFLQDGLDVKQHLQRYLNLSEAELEQRLPRSTDDLADLHPGAFRAEDAAAFYEDTVGTGHLLELAAWHLGSADYIADTLRLQGMVARGQVLDFGGGIGTHALSAAALPRGDDGWFVVVIPHSRAVVEQRSAALGLAEKLSVHRDLESTGTVGFDTVVCLDVLEHLPDPSAQLLEFHQRMTPQANALLNWYFFKGHAGEYPFHFDDPQLVDQFFRTSRGGSSKCFTPC